MSNFYEINHQQYYESTVDINPTTFLTPLANCLNQGAKVLDIGCGSGRDLLWFKERGFDVTGLEVSPGLASLARKHAGCRIIEGDYLTFDFSSIKVNGVIMVGALVHQPRELVPDIIASICRCLNPGGSLLVTMKEGEGEVSRPDGREFILWNKEEVETVYASCGLTVIDFSRQISKLRPDDTWLGHVLKRKC